MTDITFTFESSRIPNALSHDFTVLLHSPIDLHDIQHECALLDMTLWNTWFNVSVALNNNTFKYYNGTTWKTVTIPDGNYNLESLEEAIHEGMKVLGDVITDGVTGSETYNINLIPNYSTIKIKLDLKNGFQVDFTTGKIHLLLGFEPNIYTTTTYATTKANLTNNVNEFFIHCSLINAGMYLNATSSDVIATLVPTVPPGAIIKVSNDNPIYMPIRDSRFFDNIRMYITDQLGRPVNLNGHTVTYRIHVKPRQMIGTR